MVLHDRVVVVGGVQVQSVDLVEGVLQTCKGKKKKSQGQKRQKVTNRLLICLFRSLNFCQFVNKLVLRQDSCKRLES